MIAGLLRWSDPNAERTLDVFGTAAVVAAVVFLPRIPHRHTVVLILLGRLRVLYMLIYLKGYDVI